MQNNGVGSNRRFQHAAKGRRGSVISALSVRVGASTSMRLLGVFLIPLFITQCSPPLTFQPGAGKSEQQFVADARSCHDLAYNQVMGLAGRVSLSFSQFTQTVDKLNSECMISRGNIDTTDPHAGTSYASAVAIPPEYKPRTGSAQGFARPNTGVSARVIPTTDASATAAAEEAVELAARQSSHGDDQTAYRTLVVAWDDDCERFEPSYRYHPNQCYDIAYHLGIMLANGIGTAQDTRKAWLRLGTAASQNHPEAYLDMVNLYNRDPRPVQALQLESGISSMFLVGDLLNSAVRARVPGAQEKLAAYQQKIQANNDRTAAQNARERDVKKTAFLALPSNEIERRCTSHCTDVGNHCISAGNFSASMGSISRSMGFADFHSTVGLEGRCEERAKSCFTSCSKGDDID